MAKGKLKETMYRLFKSWPSGGSEKSSCTTPLLMHGYLALHSDFLVPEFFSLWLLSSLWNIFKPLPRHGHGVLPWLAVPVVSFCVWLHNQIPHRTGRRQSLSCLSYPISVCTKVRGNLLTPTKRVYCVATRWSKPNCSSDMSLSLKCQGPN